MLIGQSYVMQRRPDKAIEQFERAFDLSSGHSEERKMLKAAIRLLTPQIRRIRRANIAAYIITIEIGSFEVQITKNRYDALIVLSSNTGRRTSPIALGSFGAKTSCPLVFKSEPYCRHLESISHVDVWIDGCSSLAINHLTIIDDRHGKKLSFDRGEWTEADYNHKKVLRMKPLHQSIEKESREINVELKKAGGDDDDDDDGDEEKR